MSLILDALKRARQLGQGKAPSTEAQNLMKSFGTSQRSRRRRARKTVFYILPILLLAGGMALAGNYWLKKKAQGSMAVASDVGPVANAPTPPPADPPAPEQPPAPEPAVPVKQAEPAATAPPTPTAAAPKPPATAASNPAPRAATTAPPAVATGAAETISTPPTPDRQEPAKTVAPPVVDPPQAPAAATPTTAPATPSVVRETPGGNAWDQMEHFWRIGNYAQALPYCAPAKQAYPRQTGVYELCGAVYFGLGKFPEALAEFTTVIRMEPTKSSAFVNIAAVYLLQNQNILARDAADKAVLLDPGNAKAYYNRGLAAARLRQPFQAKNDLMQAVQKAPDYIDARLELAKIYDAEGETGSAIEQYEKFRELALGLPAFNMENVRALERIEALKKKIPPR